MFRNSVVHQLAQLRSAKNICKNMQKVSGITTTPGIKKRLQAAYYTLDDLLNELEKENVLDNFENPDLQKIWAEAFEKVREENERLGEEK